MSEVERYRLEHDWNKDVMVESPDGRYVLYGDYAALRERVQELEGPGSLRVRFGRVMEVLEQVFPHPAPYNSTEVPETYYLHQLATLTMAHQQAVEAGHE